MASSKNFTEVLIGGKVFTLSGFESEEYLQKVSTYLNHKIDECSSSEGYRKQSAVAPASSIPTSRTFADRAIILLSSSTV